jgi:hypothetical protein
LEEKIQILQNQVASLQQNVIKLETKLENRKYALSGSLKPPESLKTIKQVTLTLELKKEANMINSEQSFQ